MWLFKCIWSDSSLARDLLDDVAAQAHPRPAGQFFRKGFEPRMPGNAPDTGHRIGNGRAECTPVSINDWIVPNLVLRRLENGP